MPFAVIATVLTDTALTARGRRLQAECGRFEYDRPGRSAARANRSTLARSRLPWRAAAEAARVAGAANRAARPPATCGGRTAAHAPHRGKNDAAPHPVRSARRAWPLADRAPTLHMRETVHDFDKWVSRAIQSGEEWFQWDVCTYLPTGARASLRFNDVNESSVITVRAHQIAGDNSPPGPGHPSVLMFNF